MNMSIDYYLCLISPWTYFGDKRLNQIATRFGATINYKPINLGEVFPKTGGLPLAKRAPSRRNNRMQELIRWSNYLDIPINLEPAFFPTDEKLAATIVLAAQQSGLDCGPLVSGFLSAVWREQRDIADKETMLAVADECGFDGAKLYTAGQNNPEIAELWQKNSATALEIGVFGAPTYVFEDQLFWGQDRLDFLTRALEKA